MNIRFCPYRKAIWLFALSCIVPFTSLWSNEVDDHIDLIEKRILLKQDAARARMDWKIEKGELEHEAKFLETEITSLQEKLDKLLVINEELINREESESKELEANREIVERLKTTVVLFEERVLALNLPLPLRMDVARLIGESEIRDSGNVGSRFQKIIDALNLVHRFNKKPYFGKEVYERGDGESLQLDTLYWGLSTGFRLDPAGKTVQVGRPSGGQWEWADASEHVDAIRQVMNIFQSNEVPVYVNMPLQILGE